MWLHFCGCASATLHKMATLLLVPVSLPQDKKKAARQAAALAPWVGQDALATKVGEGAPWSKDTWFVWVLVDEASHASRWVHGVRMTRRSGPLHGTQPTETAPKNQIIRKDIHHPSTNPPHCSLGVLLSSPRPGSSTGAQEAGPRCGCSRDV